MTLLLQRIPLFAGALALSTGVAAPAARSAESAAAGDVSRREITASAGLPSVGCTMAQVGPGAAVLTTSLLVPAGAESRQVLLRAAGPALAGFGVEAPLAHPALAIFNSAGEKIAGNDRWDGDEVRAASAAAGTFPFALGSNDAALMTLLPAGNYTVQVSSVAGDTGNVLLEIYDVSGATQGPALATGPQASHPAAALRLTFVHREVAEAQLLVHLPLTADSIDVKAPGRAIRARAVQFRDGAAWFDGKNSELVLPALALDHRAFALAMWIKLEDDYSSIGLVQQRAANRRSQHLHLVLRFNAPRLGFYLNDLQTVQPVGPREGWTHLVFQYNGREQEVWIDGQRAGVRAARPYLGRAGELQIGRAPRWSNVPAHDFKGGMRDLRVYSRALTPVEIRELAWF